MELTEPAIEGLGSCVEYSNSTDLHHHSIMPYVVISEVVVPALSISQFTRPEYRDEMKCIQCIGIPPVSLETDHRPAIN